MNHTVLIVEDEEELREIMREALELYGYTVVTACDGQAALDAFASIEHVCLVVLDLLMPGMNGWDFFAKMRERPELDDVPVVIHSSMPDRAPEGVTRVLRKPVDLERLVAVVDDYCAAS
jgi:CheY-like chemotaxis protein